MQKKHVDAYKLTFGDEFAAGNSRLASIITKNFSGCQPNNEMEPTKGAALPIITRFVGNLPLWRLISDVGLQINKAQNKQFKQSARKTAK
jgi:hypothetical protein